MLEYTLEDIGYIYGKSRERIRQIEEAAMTRIRELARERRIAILRD